ncbi:MAG: DUF4388 domain-containing protein [Sphaerospermopsis sp. SIO1G2]|nr:DUF4388 domain-containing protein [Sphaerospermopsis sp. SIO1G1]NET72402.1 DUF4388 domain-containing protein [Sphaerospermopsis sp. SIO1G2]
MVTNGNLRDFSLPEILQFLDSGKKTGLLHLEYLQETDSIKRRHYYIWLQKGRVIAASERSDQQGLIMMITKRGWITQSQITNATKTSICFINEPMGLCLKSQGLLQSEQLQILFNSQILRSLTQLFQVKEGTFRFENTPFLPLGEMTGLSMPGVEVMLTCLRALKNWVALEDRLPNPSIGLSNVIHKRPKVFLNSQELQVCKFLNTTFSLTQIANQLKINIKTVQQIALRLIMVGVAEENFLVADPTSFDDQEFAFIEKSVGITNDKLQKSVISQSFLKNLVNFLQAKAS